MFFGFVRRFFLPLFPGLLVAGGVYAVMAHTGKATVLPRSWLGLLPLILLGATFLLGALFRQFRVSLIAVPCAAVAWRCLPMDTPADGAVAVASLLLPCWFTVAGLQKERRPFSVSGLVALSVALALTALLLLPAAHRQVAKLAASIALKPVESCHTWWTLSPASLGLASVAAIALIIPRTNRRTNVLLLQSLLFELIALNAHADVFRPLAPQPLFVTAGAASGALLLWAVLDGAWQHAFVDELTQLPGRRPLTQHLASLGRRYSVAVVDIDHFKRVNDRHGHDVGDQVLRYIAARLKTCRHGTAYRFGGEEFVIVFGGSRHERHLNALEELRETVGGRPFVVRGTRRPKRRPKKTRKDLIGERKKLKITVSIGVARSTPERRKPNEVLKAADKALYKAKRGGRNRVCKA